MSEILKECNFLINNIYRKTITVLTRNNPDEIKKLTELGIDFNIELGELNEETEKILNDRTWRRK